MTKPTRHAPKSRARGKGSGDGVGPTVFITGTDTGVGKTVLTALLLGWGRSRGRGFLAIKPFATGGLQDAELLDDLQDHALPLSRLCPFRFRAPLAPLIAARLERRSVSLEAAVAAVRGVRAGVELLLVEGCGGLLTPLGPGYCALEMIRALQARPVVVAPNRLGVLNQTRLVLQTLATAIGPAAAVVLMGTRSPDLSVRWNRATLQELVAPVPVFELPWLGPRVATPGGIRRAARTRAFRLGQIEQALRAGA